MTTVRSGENFASAAAMVQPMMTPEPGEENGTGSFGAIDLLAAEEGSRFIPGRGRKTVASAGIETVASEEAARTPVRSITVAPEL